MLRIAALVALDLSMLVACGNPAYAVRPVPRIAADAVGKPISRMREALGEPRKIDTTPSRIVYVWFLEQAPAGAPAGFHGCELEVTVDPRSEHVLGYTLSNVGWARCPEIERKILIAER